MRYSREMGTFEIRCGVQSTTSSPVLVMLARRVKYPRASSMREQCLPVATTGHSQDSQLVKLEVMLSRVYPIRKAIGHRGEAQDGMPCPIWSPKEL